MPRTFVFKLKPTVVQAAGFQRYLDVTRDVYNAALEQRITAYRTTGRSPDWMEQSREIKDLRAAGMLEGCYAQVVHDTMKRLNKTYAAFFRGAGFPRFRGYRHWRSFTFHQYGKGCALRDRRLHVFGVGSIRVRQHRELEGTPKTATIVRKADGWYVHIVSDLGEAPALRGGGRTTGIDLGLEAFATLADGERIANPRHARKAAKKLAKEQRVLRRKTLGSGRRDKQRQRVALAYLAVARARRDFHHKLALDLVRRFDRIAVEDLAVAAMKRKGGVYKRGLNRSMADAGWGEFLTVLAEKCQQHGVELVAVDPRGTSQTCSDCGQPAPKDLSVRWHDCECGSSLHRDENAARNIRNRAWGVPVVETA